MRIIWAHFCCCSPKLDKVPGVLTHYLGDKQEFDVSSEGPSSRISIV